MNAEDLDLLVTLTARTRAVVENLARLVQFIGPTDAQPVIADLEALEVALGLLITKVQDREVRSWNTDRPPAQPAPRHLRARGLPGPTEIPPGVPVRRYGITGLLLIEERARRIGAMR